MDSAQGRPHWIIDYAVTWRDAGSGLGLPIIPQTQQLYDQLKKPAFTEKSPAKKKQKKRNNWKILSDINHVTNNISQSEVQTKLKKFFDDFPVAVTNSRGQRAK